MPPFRWAGIWASFSLYYRVLLYLPAKSKAIILSDSMTTKPQQPELRRIRPTKLSTEVARQLLELIRSGTFPVGARLPPEKELADRMGVSRASVREALAALGAVGLVESHPGRGNFVRSLPASAGLAEPLILLESEAAIQEIIEARAALEPQAAGLAALHRNPEDLERLETVHSAMIRHAQEGHFDLYFAYDKAFHQALLQATQNRLLARVLLPLVETMDQHVYREFTSNFYLKSPQAFRRVLAIHSQILRAVEEQDAKRACRHMKTHWQRMKRVYES